MPDFFMFSPDDLPDEIKEQVERHRMQHSDATHARIRFVKELNEDDRETLANLLRDCSRDESTASFYIGILAALSAADTGNCLACGRNHDADAAALLAADGPDAAPTDTGTPEPPQAASEPGSAPTTSADDIAAIVQWAKANGYTVDGEHPAPPLSLGQRIEMSVEYNVEPVNDGEYDGSMRCTGIEGSLGPCGMTYPSLEDRMLRRPNECSGCFARAGQG